MGEAISQQIQRVLRHFKSTPHNLKLHIIWYIQHRAKVTSPVPNFNMKVFTMSCLVFVVVAIAMIAATTGEITGKCEAFLEQINECQKSSPAELMACCKNIGLPFECSGYCSTKKMA